MIEKAKKILSHPVLAIPIAFFLLWGLFNLIFLIGSNSIVWMDTFLRWLYDTLNDPAIISNIL